MEHILGLLSAWLIRNKAIEPNDRELYEYAIYSFLISIAPLAIFLIASGAMGMWWEGILIIVPFMLIRKFSGGYHAKHAYVCFLASTGLLGVSLCIVAFVNSSWIIHILLCVSGISLTINSPIDSENKRITENEKMRYKHVTHLLVVMFLLVYVVLNVFRLERFSTCVGISMILTALLQLPCVFAKYKTNNL
ncbi:MAG: accessory gene regulator B family protein [Lachnospiraceae bacterium]|nr:accessory gene regulator B family protein [Lachnospiraceae bacterium]